MHNVVLYALAKRAVGAVTTAVSELAPGYSFQGSVSTVDDLPASAEKGALYIVTDGAYNDQYVWDGASWLFIGRTNVQINAFNS